MSLHREAVLPELLALLHEMMGEEALRDFALAGGTSLALRFGHRLSVDIDLFTATPFDAPELAAILKERHGMAQVSTSRNTVVGVVGGIKVDLLAHIYPLLAEVEPHGAIRMLSLADVAAMKLNAIANRGSKKDFWDLAELLERFTRDEMLAFYAAKYPRDSVWNVERSLSYFDDADGQPDPRDLHGRRWEDVKRTIQRHNRL